MASTVLRSKHHWRPLWLCRWFCFVLVERIFGNVGQQFRERQTLLVLVWMQYGPCSMLNDRPAPCSRPSPSVLEAVSVLPLLLPRRPAPLPAAASTSRAHVVAGEHVVQLCERLLLVLVEQRRSPCSVLSRSRGEPAPRVRVVATLRPARSSSIFCQVQYFAKYNILPEQIQRSPTCGMTPRSYPASGHVHLAPCCTAFHAPCPASPSRFR